MCLLASWFVTFLESSRSLGIPLFEQIRTISEHFLLKKTNQVHHSERLVAGSDSFYSPGAGITSGELGAA